MTMTITAEQLKEAEERWKTLRDARDPAAAEAEAEFQRMARSQTEDLQAAAHARLISQMLK
jgi:hypothetical protein